MIKVIVAGACGRMGSRVCSLVLAEKDMELAGAVERQGHASLGKDMRELLGLGRTGIILQENLKEVIDSGLVIIDFSAPESTLAHLRLAVEHKTAMVIGTTGFSQKQAAEIKDLAQNIPCLLSPNMSLGVNLLFKVAGDVARALGDEYDIEIVEAHHRRKKDAPSGTAKRLAEILSEARGQSLEDVAVYGRKGMTGERPKKAIGIHSVRGGDIVGDHKVIFAGEGERVELIHRAHSRDTFARGAILAARFVAGAPKGLYSMQDVLKKLKFQR